MQEKNSGSKDASTISSRSRRRYLGGLITLGITGLAGCSEGGTDGDEGGSDGSGDGSSDTEQTGPDEATNTTQEPDSGADEPTTDNGGDDQSDPDETQSDDDTTNPQTLGDVLSMPSSYIVDSVFEDPSGRTTESTQYVDDGDARLEFASSPATIYRVDGTTYQVTDQGCRELSGSGTTATDPIYSDRGAERPITGRDTVDGQEVYVVDITVEDETDTGTVTLNITNYVSVETGRMVRAEQEPVNSGGMSEFTYRYESFEPVELPESC